MFRIKVCYACLSSESKDLVHLYNLDLDLISYWDKLKSCVCCDLLQDNVTMEICSPCLTELKMCYAFKKTVLQSQEKLKKFAQGTNSLNDIFSGHECTSKNEIKLEDDKYALDDNTYLKSDTNDYDSDSSDCVLSDLKTKLEKNPECDETKPDVYRNEQNKSDEDRKPAKKKAKEKIDGKLRTYVKKEKPDVLHECQQCDLVFNKRWKLKKHVNRVHTEERKYVCTYCNQGFKQSFHLREHITKHTGERKYTCSFCDKSFQRISSQRRHMRSHEALPGQKTKRTPFLCTICGKSFPFSNGVQRHMRIHTGVKNHECHLCNRKFAQSTHLHVHMRTHTGEKPYICDLCGEAFSLNASLRKHVAVHRNNSAKENYLRVYLVNNDVKLFT